MKKILIVFSFVIPLVATPAIADLCNGRPQDDIRPGCGVTDPPIPHRGSGRNHQDIINTLIQGG
jgi:hypothetical protein